ncbi:MAG TPA: hypothetical protein PLT45_08025 [Smithella sp.]|nr:hypothetical protein [Smithella sp.]
MRYPKSTLLGVFVAVFLCPLTVMAQLVGGPVQEKPTVKQESVKPAVGTAAAKPLLSATPREINLGTIVADKAAEGTFVLNNVGGGTLEWSVGCPQDWETMKDQPLKTVSAEKTDSLRVEVNMVSGESSAGDEQGSSYIVEMRLVSASGGIACKKQMTVGAHKEAIKITSNGGEKTVFVVFTIVYAQKNARINLKPSRLDMGKVAPDKAVSRRITLTNSGRETLNWSVALREHDEIGAQTDFSRGRYLSFYNEEIRGKGMYVLPAHLKDMTELTGSWLETDGYPSGAEGENIIKINFQGRGVYLYLFAYPEEVNLVISLDKRLIKNPDLFKNLKEKKGEIIIADELENGPHVLTITSRDSRIVLEGLKILGEPVNYFPAESIKIVPNSGATSRQSNYLGVTLNPARLAPGYYAGDIVFNTNSGEATVEIFAEILPETITQVIDIYRYFNGTDYMFTANPEAEARRLAINQYVKEGIAFRLFAPGTPGTTAFYRWYHPGRKSHFYHYQADGGGKDLRGYIFEGPVGNIATSRLTNTRELYRWYNAKTGHYFYTTEIQGGKVNKKAYRFDGIAGYVRP